jgi:serine/threonine protein kinase
MLEMNIECTIDYSPLME